MAAKERFNRDQNIPSSIRLDIEPIESVMKTYNDNHYSDILDIDYISSIISRSELDNIILRMIDDYLANYNKESFILDDEDYVDFFDTDEKGYKAIAIEKDNYDIPSDAGEGVSCFKTIQLALLDLIFRLLLEKGN